MAQLRWIEVEDGYESGDYRISPVRDTARPRWRLEIVERPAGPDGSPAQVSTSFHGSLRLAKTSADRNELERVNRRRVTGYLYVGGVAALAVLTLAPVTDSLGLFVATMVLVAVAVRSFANAAGIAYGDAWAWTRDDGTPQRVTLTDRAVVRLVDGLRPSPRVAPVGAPAAVRVLPPVDRR